MSVWPTALNSKHESQLKRALRKEGLKLHRLVWSVSPSDGDIIVNGDAIDPDTKELLEFEASWRMDPKTMSLPISVYKMVGLEIYE